ncbi:hypothetical protein AB1328_32610, partial [Streptomyces virginiae]
MLRSARFVRTRSSLLPCALSCGRSDLPARSPETADVRDHGGMTEVSSLTGRLLVATPALADPNF